MQAVAKNIDEYIDLQSEDVRTTLINIRHTIKKAVPEAEELISYQMPAFRFKKILVWFAAFKKHYTIFFPGKVLQEFKDELQSYELIKSGAGIKIPLGTPVPDQLISKIVKARKSEIISPKDAMTQKK
jgi:uncharacterized protein YdhG (YjbR/CyaY superfamily)